MYGQWIGIKRGTDLAYFKHILAAGNLNYGITEICSIFRFLGATSIHSHLDNFFSTYTIHHGSVEFHWQMFANFHS